MQSNWKEIELSKGKYLISDKGEVFSVVKGKIRPSHYDKDGYKIITFMTKEFNKTCKIHRLVAQAFIPNPENKPQVNHIDGNKGNNIVDNLEWVSMSENVRHAYEKLPRKKCITKKFKTKVRYLETGEVFESVREASRNTPLGRTAIISHCEKKTKISKYEYVEEK